MSVPASKVKYSLTPLDITHSPGVEQLDEEEKQVIIIITNGKGRRMYCVYCVLIPYFPHTDMFNSSYIT